MMEAPTASDPSLNSYADVIVSEQSVRRLLEAFASTYALACALLERLDSLGELARTPDEATRAFFLARVCAEFPELAPLARSVGIPRPFVPPPSARLPTAGAPDPLPDDKAAAPSPSSPI